MYIVFQWAIVINFSQLNHACINVIITTASTPDIDAIDVKWCYIEGGDNFKSLIIILFHLVLCMSKNVSYVLQILYSRP